LFVDNTKVGFLTLNQKQQSFPNSKSIIFGRSHNQKDSVSANASILELILIPNQILNSPITNNKQQQLSIPILENDSALPFFSIRELLAFNEQDPLNR